jgi:hypothetical protein
MKILVSYRAAPRIRGWETGSMLARAFRVLGHDVAEYANIYETKQWIADRAHILNQSYDLHVFMEKNDPESQYTELLSLPITRTVGWLFDIAMYPDFNYNLVERFHFDHLYLANPNYLDKFKCPTSFLPYAADERYFYRSLDTIKTRDLCLVGSDRPERRQFIQMLRNNGVNAELISGIFKQDYINALASSKIILNDLAGGGGALLSMRAFETLATGSALLQADTGEPHNDILMPNLACLMFKDHISCITQINKYLSDKELYDNTRAVGQKMVLDNHTYVNRAREILSA